MTMRLIQYGRRLHALGIIAFLLLAASSWPAQAVDLYLGHTKANRILFFGNSITIAPHAVPGTNWTGGWGMASSVPEKDYVHLVTSSIAQDAGGMPEVMATYNLQFELNYATYDLNSPEMQAQMAFNPDIVVVAIGENVPALSTVQAQADYAAAFGNLLNHFKGNGNPKIFVRSCFWADATKDNIMRDVTNAAGDVFIDQSSLAITANWASQEPENPFCNAGNGVNQHPGDQGMQAIADSLYGSMVAHSMPEPGPLVMLGAAVPLLALWIRRVKYRKL